ncbi:hypothetical protein ELQ90_09865 [Labedella phragmitis]|uniref:Uncharacterized protein n=1 Tax=Labedella phragmitis TaxID=2498849 RepID=A0A444PTB1_9MICO|nr:hypothetical protein [Labedella phragmitis]RWZ51089.1 hypothetical protein ELQ90_09865 [Labedella phragmitis]
MVSIVLVAGLALAGCTGGSPEPTRSATAGGTTRTPTPSSADPSESAPPSTSPSATPTPTTPAVAWTPERAYAACIDFHRDKTAADGLDPDSATWNPYSPEVVRQSGSEWLVDLIGTVTDPDGNQYDGIFSCTVGGTPAAPAVSESAGM